MGNSRMTILIFTLLIASSSYSQFNISFERDCLVKNSAMLGYSLIKSVHRDSIIGLFENNIQFITFWDVDSLGNIVQFKGYRSKAKLSKSVFDKVEAYFRRNKFHFSICYEAPVGLNRRESYQLIRNDLMQNGRTTYSINVAFPGELMTFYEYDNRKAKCKMSKYRYLTKQINKNR